MFQVRKMKRILFFYAYFFILLSILFLTGKVQEQAAANTVTRQQERAMKFRTNPYRSHLLRNRRLVKTIERELKSAPVPSSFFSEITYEDSFGADRKENGDYNKNVSRIHEGLDIMYTKNKSGVVPVLSMTDGTIEQMGWLTLGGYRIGVRSKHDIYYYYAHLDRYQEGRHVGDQIKAGEILGFMGDTGYGKEGTKGKFPVHLHFGIYVHGKNGQEMSLNPYPFFSHFMNGIR